MLFLKYAANRKECTLGTTNTKLPNSEEELYLLRTPSEALIDFCTKTMVKEGLSLQDAKLTAEILVRTDMRGIYTHGTVALRRYVQLMRDGGINVNAIPQITAQGPAWSQIDAHRAVGMVASHYGMSKAIENAEKCGVGITTVRQSNHFGAASAYTLMALDQSMIGIAIYRRSQSYWSYDPDPDSV